MNKIRFVTNIRILKHNFQYYWNDLHKLNHVRFIYNVFFIVSCKNYVVLIIPFKFFNNFEFSIFRINLNG